MSLAANHDAFWQSEEAGLVGSVGPDLAELPNGGWDEFDPQVVDQVFSQVVDLYEANVSRHGSEPVPQRWIDEGDMLRIFLHDVGKRFSLTGEQEMALACKVHAGQTAATELTIQDPEQRNNSLPETALDSQLRDAETARDIFFRLNVPLVVAVAKRFSHSGIPLTDLVQEGTAGLRQAIEGYDPHKGCRFSTYARPKIFAACQRYAQEHAGPFKTPTAVYKEYRRLREYRQDLIQQLHRQPTIKEMALAANRSEQKIGQILTHVSDQAFSLDAPFGDGDESWGSRTADTNAVPPEEAALERLRGNAVLRLVSGLPKCDREVLILRYGLGGVEPMSRKAAAEKLGLKYPQVEWVERRALAKLKARTDSSWMDWLE